MSKGFASSYRIILLSTGLFVCFGGLAMRLVWLHVVDRDSLLKTITKARAQLIPEKARRGDIRDARGAILATSSSKLILGVDPQSLRPQDEKKWPQLAALIGVPEDEISRIFRTKYREPGAKGKAAAAKAGAAVVQVKFTPPGTTEEPAAGDDDDDSDLDPTPDEKGRRVIRWAKLREDVTESLYLEVQKLGIKGVYGDRVFHRAYPNNQLAAHIIGYVNKQQEAVTGIEYNLDFFLRGQQGWRVGERDGRGGELPQFLTRQVPPSHGFSVMLSIDLIVQDIVEQELAYIADKFQPLKASIIVSDPRTGFVLGMGNYPTFNPNEYNKVPKDEMARMKNTAVADIYEPGSVFKIVAASGALEERLVTPASTFDCSQERITRGARTYKLPGEDHKMGTLTVSEIISHSSNRGAAQLGLALGEARLEKYARAFGFGSKLGFPVGAEVNGLLYPHKKWSGNDVVIIPMGHTVSATVLQMHQAMSVVAAGGVLLRPQVISQIRDASNEIVYRYDREEIGRAVSPETARAMAQMLTGVVKPGGTAVEAAIDGFDVAGKTGTSQKIIEGKYSKSHHIASFVGFFPAGRPQVVISVVVDDADHRAPNGIAYGRTVASPSFRRIAERLIPILNVQAESRPASNRLVAVVPGGHK